jgi:hypothetical protein
MQPQRQVITSQGSSGHGGPANISTMLTAAHSLTLADTTHAQTHKAWSLHSALLKHCSTLLKAAQHCSPPLSTVTATLITAAQSSVRQHQAAVDKPTTMQVPGAQLTPHRATPAEPPTNTQPTPNQPPTNTQPKPNQNPTKTQPKPNQWMPVTNVPRH